MRREKNQSSNRELLSIVVPAYREEKTIIRTLSQLNRELSQMSTRYEIICVVDGQVDGTYKKAKNLRLPNLKVMTYQQNYGKGYAVRQGLSQAKGSVVGFVDANGINPSSLRMVYEHFKWYGADVIVGSKRHPVSKIIYPIPRRVVSWGYQMLIKTLFNLEIKDTQVGLKLFTRSVINSVLPKMQVNDFAFDIEMLAYARILGFKRIYEAPVQLELSTNKNISSVFSKGFVRSILKVFLDTLKVYYRVKFSNFSKRIWLSGSKGLSS